LLLFSESGNTGPSYSTAGVILLDNKRLDAAPEALHAASATAGLCTSAAVGLKQYRRVVSCCSGRLGRLVAAFFSAGWPWDD